MLVTKQKRVRHPRKEVLEAVSEAFREIEATFELLGFSAREDESSKEEPPQEEAENEEQEEEYEEDSGEDLYGEDEDSGGGVFQREDIEVAMDIFISSLVREKVIPKIKSSKQPSLADIFERIFGEDHEIIKLVEAFDEHIEGYFGAIGYDDMNSAYGEVSAIRDIINKELERHA